MLLPNIRQNYFTVIAMVIRKFPEAKVDYILKRENSDGYQNVINTKNIEFCKILKNTKQAPIPFIKTFIDFIKSAATGNFLEFCDTIGEIRFANVSYTNYTLFEMYPAGRYIGSYLFHDDSDDQHHTDIQLVEILKIFIKTTIKTTDHVRN